MTGLVEYKPEEILGWKERGRIKESNALPNVWPKELILDEKILILAVPIENKEKSLIGMAYFSLPKKETEDRCESCQRKIIERRLLGPKEKKAHQQCS